MSPEELQALEGKLREKFPSWRLMEVRELEDGTYEIAMMNLASNPDLAKRIDQHTEIK
jgi:hypothetical protein